MKALLISIVAIFLLSNGAFAATKNIIYINGIQNTLEDAFITLKTLKKRLAESTNRAANMRSENFVAYIWNPIGWSGAENGPDFAEDVAELYLEKTAEEKFSSDFEKILAPHNESRVVDKAAATRVVAYLDDMTPGGNSLEAGLQSDSFMDRSQRAARSLVAKVLSMQPAIVVAHSQGNLLANLAHAKISSEYGNDVYKILRVVNVANASVFSVSGLNLTHAKDAALYSAATDAHDLDLSLEVLGQTHTRTTPRCTNFSCRFLLGGAPFGGVDSTGGILDHAINETYLSDVNLPVVMNTQGVNFTPGATRFIDRLEDFIYAAADSLDLYNQNTWSQSAPFPSLPDRPGVMSFSIGGKGYIAIPGVFNQSLREMWEFDPVAKVWTKHKNHPEFEDRSPYFVVGSHAYVISANAVWRYAPSTDQWTRMKDKFQLSSIQIEVWGTLKNISCIQQ